MKVVPVVPRGYCHGVVRAIRTLEHVLADPAYPRPIHLLGMIVHNQFVVDDFRRQGVLCWDEAGKTRLELLENIHSGTVVITAHGTGDIVLNRIREKGLTFVDATCRDVYKTHDLIKDHLARGYRILYVGKNGHPETEGVLSLDPTILLVEKVSDISRMGEINTPLFVTNQTTFSIREIDAIFQAVRSRYPHVEISEEICSATRTRQEGLLKANEGSDACVVVGDPHSNNTESLARLSEEITKIPTFRVASADDLKPDMFRDMNRVTVTSGASTPPEITDAVIRKLETF